MTVFQQSIAYKCMGYTILTNSALWTLVWITEGGPQYCKQIMHSRPGNSNQSNFLHLKVLFFVCSIRVFQLLASLVLWCTSRILIHYNKLYCFRTNHRYTKIIKTIIILINSNHNMELCFCISYMPYQLWWGHTLVPSITSIRAPYIEILSYYCTWISWRASVFSVSLYVALHHYMNWKLSSLVKWPCKSRKWFRSQFGFHNKAVDALCLGHMDSFIKDVCSILWNITNNFDSTI